VSYIRLVGNKQQTVVCGFEFMLQSAGIDKICGNIIKINRKGATLLLTAFMPVYPGWLRVTIEEGDRGE